MRDSQKIWIFLIMQNNTATNIMFDTSTFYIQMPQHFSGSLVSHEMCADFYQLTVIAWNRCLIYYFHCIWLLIQRFDHSTCIMPGWEWEKGIENSISKKDTKINYATRRSKMMGDVIKTSNKSRCSFFSPVAMIYFRLIFSSRILSVSDF